MTTSLIENAFHAQVRKEAGRFIWLGAALLVIGIVALVFPVVSTLVATIFVGWLLIFSGAVTLYGSFSIRGAGPFFGALLFGLLCVAAGVFMLARPQGGELAITLSLGVLFMVQGAFEILLALELRPARSWGWMLISAAALLAENMHPADEQIRAALAPHLCRCGVYLRMIRAVKRAAQ